MKRICMLIILVSVFIGLSAGAAYAESKITVMVNGIELKTDAEPFIQNGSTLVPLRAIAEALNIEILWDAEDRSIFYFNNEGTSYYLVIGSTQVQIGQGAGIDPLYETISVAPVIVNGSTFVPLRFIAESLGVKMDYDAATRTVYVGGAPTTPAAPAKSGYYKAFPSVPSFSAVSGVIYKSESISGDVFIVEYDFDPNSFSASDLLASYSSLLAKEGFEFSSSESHYNDFIKHEDNVLVDEQKLYDKITYYDKQNNVKTVAESVTNFSDLTANYEKTPQTIYAYTYIKVTISHGTMPDNSTNSTPNFQRLTPDLVLDL